MRFDLNALSDSSDPIAMALKNDLDGKRVHIFSNTYCIELAAF